MSSGRQGVTRTMAVCLVVVVAAAMLPRLSGGVAVMSVDLGGEWVKVGVVTPGHALEIVLNRESRRKTPLAVGFKADERLFGEAATTLVEKKPELVFRYFRDLLGVHWEEGETESAAKQAAETWLAGVPLPPVVSSSLELALHLPDGSSYSPEELTAMMLNYSRQLAADTAGQPVTGCVLSVPAWFSQSARRALLRAAQLVQLPVLQLLSSPAAVALHYGAFSTQEITTKPSTVLFADVGATGTTVTVVQYVVSTEKNGKTPSLKILGQSWDRGVSGLAMDILLANEINRRFEAQGNSKAMEGLDAARARRSRAKLLREASRVKTILSANSDHVAQVESYIGEKDLRIKMTRTEFESLCAPFFPLLSKVISSALSSASLSPADLDHVLLVGGASRVPWVQRILQEDLGRQELGKNVNADEAVALGCALRAAALSPAFRVRPFVVTDSSPYPLLINFWKDESNSDATSEGATVHTPRQIQRLLYPQLSPAPQRKVVTFNRRIGDFSLTLSYGNLSLLPPEFSRVLNQVNISEIQLEGVATAISSAPPSALTRGVKAHFLLDDNGILTLDRAEVVFEVEEEVIKEEEEPSTLRKLGNTISSLFTGGEKNETEDDGKELGEGDTDAEGGAGAQEPNPTPAPAPTDAPSPTTAVPEVNEPKGKVSRKVKITRPVMATVTVMDYPTPSTTQVDESKSRLEALSRVDEERAERERALSNLEAFIFDTLRKLEDEELHAVTRPEERAELETNLRTVSNWLDEEGYAADTKMLKNKHRGLRSAWRGLSTRLVEAQARPALIQALNITLNHSSTFLSLAKLFPAEQHMLTSTEIAGLESLIHNTSAWLEEAIKVQAALPAWENPHLKAADLRERKAELDREVNILGNKLRFSKPVVSKKKPAEENDTNTNQSGQEGAGGKRESEADGVGGERGKETEDVGVKGGVEGAGEERVSEGEGGEKGTEGTGSKHEEANNGKHQENDSEQRIPSATHDSDEL
uniref:hypoxia up-regulated protein 1 isoform X2 n=1 Tax=Myxine glutinosa TaxID=7769 RepID=UPI003590203E